MISDRPYLQNWRPVYELSSAVVWFSAMNIAHTLSFFSSLPPIGFILTSSFCTAMTITRLAQAIPRWQQHRRLKGKKLALAQANPEAMPIAANKESGTGSLVRLGV